MLLLSISRFARNTVDTLNVVRFLREKGIGVYFEEENINTKALQGELLITILGSLAQQEIENMSTHIVAGLEMAIKNGTKKVSHVCYGYDYHPETGTFTINKDAENVKLIFELYSKYANRSKVIAELNKRNIKSPRGCKIWTSTSLETLLTNEKYIGNAVFGNTYVYDSITHRHRINKGERKKYRYLAHHEPIISKELFDDVNEKIKNVKKRYKGRKAQSDKENLMAWKGLCGFCGTSISKYDNRNDNLHTYKCLNTRLKTTKELCTNSVSFKSIEIENCFLKGMKKLRNKINLNTLDEEIEEKISFVRSMIINTNLDKFNFELYNKIVQIVVIGGYDKNRTPNPYLIRFILKEDLMFDDKYKNRRKFNDKTKEILSFDNKINILRGTYDEKRLFSRKKIDSIRVTIEVQDDESLIWKL